jgi:hypothetical protein
MFPIFTPNIYKVFENIHILRVGGRIHQHATIAKSCLAQQIWDFDGNNGVTPGLQVIPLPLWSG